jgi:hypothetical protein
LQDLLKTFYLRHNELVKNVINIRNDTKLKTNNFSGESAFLAGFLHVCDSYNILFKSNRVIAKQFKKHIGTLNVCPNLTKMINATNLEATIFSGESAFPIVPPQFGDIYNSLFETNRVCCTNYYKHCGFNTLKLLKMIWNSTNLTTNNFSRKIEFWIIFVISARAFWA